MSITHFKQLDWDFPDQNSRKFLHNLCWYPSRFIPMIPAQLIEALSQRGELVFDPFGGSGTVLLESLRQGRESVCMDLNPVGCFIAKTKAKVFSKQKIDMNALLSIYEVLLTTVNKNKSSNLFSSNLKIDVLKDQKINNAQLIEPWYHPDTFKELITLFTYIESVSHNLTKDILRLLFMSIVMPSSGHKAGRPYTYYADNVKPKDLIKKDAIKLYYQRLKRFISEYNENALIADTKQKWEVITGDSRNIPNRLKAKVDLIITSPPYVGVTDYMTAFRLTHLWYDWDLQLESLKKHEIGPRWRRKQSDVTEKYLNDLKICFSEMYLALKPNRHLCIVIGESKKHSDKIKSKLLSYLTDSSKFKLVHSASRELSQKFFIHPSGGVKTEDIIILRKNKNG